LANSIFSDLKIKIKKLKYQKNIFPLLLLENNVKDEISLVLSVMYKHKVEDVLV